MPVGLRDPRLPEFMTPVQRRDARKRAMKRAEGQLEDREKLRQAIRGRRLLGAIQEDIGALRDPQTELSSKDINRKKVALDANFRLLNKLLPDVKAVELTDDRDSGDPARLTTSELRELVMGLAVEAKKERAIAGECTVEEPAPKNGRNQLPEPSQRSQEPVSELGKAPPSMTSREAFEANPLNAHKAQKAELERPPKLPWE